MLLILLGMNSSTSTCSHHTQYRNHPCASATLVKQTPRLKLVPRRTSYRNEGHRQSPELQVSWGTKEENTTSAPASTLAIHLCFHLFPFVSDEMHLNETIFYTAFHMALYTFHSKWLLGINEVPGKRGIHFTQSSKAKWENNSVKSINYISNLRHSQGKGFKIRISEP